LNMAQKEARKPDEIRQDIYSHLSWDDRIDESHITVDVSDSTVILSGTVPTYPSLIQAERDAYDIPGVKSVKNRLSVLFPTTYPTPSDADIGGTIRNLLQINPTIDDHDIQVSVLNSVVTLSGTVSTAWQKTRAGYIAINVDGVVELDNNLQVLPKGTIGDEDIRRDIESSLARNAFVNPEHISVEVHDAQVVLSGDVDNYQEYRTAGRIAVYTGGVVSVTNNLTIR
jgi:osmotically-inducible protein OsmY